MKLHKLLRPALFSVVALAAGYAVWSRSGRRPPEDPLDLHLGGVLNFGTDTWNGNLLGVQPYLVPSDFASADRLHEKLDGYLAAAAEEHLLGPKTVVVFPEFLGTWLVVAGEKQSVFRAPSVQSASTTLALSNLPSFVRGYASAPCSDRLRYAVFQTKATEMAEAYQSVFSRLAQERHVWLVAGSTVLPSPQVKDGKVLAGTGPLYNVSAVFAPDGRAQEQLVRKVFLTDEELPFETAGGAEGLPVFDTPAGRLGVLICADSWYPQAYQALKEKGVELLAVPSFGESHVGEDAWCRIWFGYQGKAPDDVDAADVQKITEGQAWLKYALAGRLQESGARAGLNVFLRGQLWDLGASGGATAVQGGQVHTGPSNDTGSVVNLWLGAPAQ